MDDLFITGDFFFRIHPAVFSCHKQMNTHDVCLSVHRCICVEKKNQLDVTECFLALIRSTCFGHFYAHLLSESFNNKIVSWCVFVCASLHMRREENPTRCHWMLSCTYDMLNMFRALLCPSSGARDCMCVITAYGVQCLVACCRVSGAGQ